MKIIHVHCGRINKYKPSSQLRTELVVKIRPEKNSGPNGIWTHDLCDTGAALYWLNFFRPYFSSVHSYEDLLNLV